MAHEVSETVKIGKRWFNRDTVGKNKGAILGNKKGFDTMRKAVIAADKRSQRADIRRKQRRKK